MLLEEILRNLSAPVEIEKLSQKDSWRKGKKAGKITYISWYDIVDLLNQRCGSTRWEWRILSCDQVSNSLQIIGELTIIGSDGRLVRQSTGDEDFDMKGYGSPGTNAEAMALRRCAAKFGLGLDLWRKEEKARLQSLGDSRNQGFSPGPRPMNTAKSVGGGLSLPSEYRGGK